MLDQLAPPEVGNVSERPGGPDRLGGASCGRALCLRACQLEQLVVWVCLSEVNLTLFPSFPHSVVTLRISFTFRVKGSTIELWLQSCAVCQKAEFQHIASSSAVKITGTTRLRPCFL